MPDTDNVVELRTDPPPYDYVSALAHLRRSVGNANCTLIKQEVVSLLQHLDELSTELVDAKKYISAEAETNPEVFRREKISMDGNPLPDLTLDYAQAGTKIDKAIMHLDEGLPNGQRRRCETAYRLLNAGVQELGLWMRRKGYRV